MNNYNCIGRLTRDWETTYTADGLAVSKNSIAVNNYKKETSFINIVALGKRAEALNQYTGKGSKIGLTGELNIREYEKDGQKRKFTEVVINSFDFCDSKQDVKPHPVKERQDIKSDDIPF